MVAWYTTQTQGPKQFYTIKGAPHNGADYYDPEGYYSAMGEFLSALG